MTEPDLGEEPVTAAGPALRAFDTALGIARFLLVALTVLLAVVGAFAAFGRGGTLSIDAEVDEPYAVELAGGRRIEVTSTGTTSDYAVDGETRGIGDVPTVRAQVEIDRDDRDTRLLVSGLLAIWLGLGWVGLTGLRGVVRAARAGLPFDPANVGRLRRVAVAFLAFPPVTEVFRRLVDGTLDVDPPVHVVVDPNWVPCALIGLGLLALAAVFRRGAELAELEAGTV